MANVTVYAMAKVAESIADENNVAVYPTAKLFAECGVTVYTPTTVVETAWELYKALSAWFMARESAGVEDESNHTLLKAYENAARKAARNWFIMFGSKPPKKDGGEARAFVALDHAEMGVLGEVRESAQSSVKDVSDDEKLKKAFCKRLMIETDRLLTGKPYIRMSDANVKACDKAANQSKKDKANKTRSNKIDKVETAENKAKEAEDKADKAEKAMADMATIIGEAIDLVEKSSATDLEKAAIIGKLKSAIATDNK